MLGLRQNLTPPASARTMVEAGQGFGVPRGIGENPYSIGHPYGERDALTPEFLVGEDVPSSASAVGWNYVSITEIELERAFSAFDGTDRTHMKDIDNLKERNHMREIGFERVFSEFDGTDRYFYVRTHMREIGFERVFSEFDVTDRTYVDIDNLRDAFSWFDESAGLDKASFMYDGEIKSRRSAMRANGMSLTMPPTPITGRSSANSREDLNLYLDSGASQNVVFNPALLINQRDPPTGTDQFMGADGSPMAVIGYGDIEMENFRIPDVYLVQGLTVNLISVGQLASSHKVCCCFAGNECNLMLSDGRRIGGAIRRDDNQYMLRFLEIE